MIKVSYYYDNMGLSCEHCGRAIKHVYNVELSDGETIKLGSTCITKVIDIVNSNIEQKELKTVQGLLNKINNLYKEYKDIQSKLSNSKREEFTNMIINCNDERFNNITDINTLKEEPKNNDNLMAIGNMQAWTTLNLIICRTKELNELCKGIKINIE